VSAGESVLITIDTSTSTGSVGVGRGEQVLAYRLPLTGREQASGIVPSISAVLADAGTDISDVSGVLVGRGPGSFTGVRVAVATARGLAKGLGVPLWPYSSLAAAAAADDDSNRRATWILFDARGDRVYAACYAFPPGKVETLVPPTAATLGEVLAADLPVEVVFAGDGAVRHADALRAIGHTVLPSPAGVPTPSGLLRLHALRSDSSGDGPPRRWEPDYLRGHSASRPPKPTGSSK
jgi:tRNA threonylcarbamoyl adenosine modification protein YeaZ